ncbi:regulatory LuxR family protein [Micromonospora pisi]|uniref:Regulatory LuxR family protein n=1 Tax=Micromonospora pisi TaxID=589240 RepID=A0A495JC30_9ACTN|nr:LuxR family transcriptional regulator [Micromonospora pisi]RKR85954.1 regulatory LuxR family protein [Micromonospora pisi]
MVTASAVQITFLRGRDAERRAVAELLRETAGGSGAALALHGPPGIGRSALLADARATAPSFTILAVAGLADETGLPYAGLQRLVEPLLDQVAALPASLARVLGRALAGGDCPPSDRFALAMAVRALLVTAGRDRPVLCTIDDVELLDRPSLDALSFAARRLHGQPVAVLFAAAPDTVLDGIGSRHLPGLDRASSTDLLADLLDEPLPDGVAAALARLAAGNPQALTDLAGALTPAQRRGDQPPPTALGPDSVLRQGYRRRLATLAPETRWLLLLAALDHELDASTLVRAAQASGTGVDALTPAEVSGLVRVGDQRVHFAHPLVRAIVHDEAPLAQRRTGHLRLAGVLDGERDRLRRALHLAAAATEPDPGLAAELERAAASGPDGYLAASHALERAARLTTEPFRVASRLLTAARYAWLAGSPYRARELLGELGGGAAKPAGSAPPDSLIPRPPTATVTVGPELRGPVALLRGEMELRSGSASAAIDMLLAAADLLTGERTDLALTALVRAGEAATFVGADHRFADLARRATALRHRDGSPVTELMRAHLDGFGAMLRGDHRRAVPPLRRVVDLATRLDDAAALAVASADSLLLADDQAAHRAAGRAVELARATGQIALLPRVLELRACAEYWLGPDEDAAATAHEGYRTAWETGQRNCAAAHLGLLAVFAAIGGDQPSCIRRVAQIGDAPVGDTRPRALAQWALGVLELAAGRCDDALARLAALADPATGRGQILVQMMAMPYLVEAAARGSDPSPGYAALAIFDRWVGDTGSPARRALSARCHALLAPRGSAAAEEGFRTALLLHPATGSKFERARTELLFGRELRRSRRPRDAREHLHTAWQTFVHLGSAYWAAQASAELRAAGETVEASPVALTGALTAQQLQIARLVAEGATNREVAARLFLSTRTVDHHMRNIFSRLGIRSRTDLVRVMS